MLKAVIIADLGSCVWILKEYFGFNGHFCALQSTSDTIVPGVFAIKGPLLLVQRLYFSRKIITIWCYVAYVEAFYINLPHWHLCSNCCRTNPFILGFIFLIVSFLCCFNFSQEFFLGYFWSQTLVPYLSHAFLCSHCRFSFKDPKDRTTLYSIINWTGESTAQ